MGVMKDGTYALTALLRFSSETRGRFGFPPRDAGVETSMTVLNLCNQGG
jgi:hypothetical protein